MALNGRDDIPLEVSRMGFSSTLKSPPRMRMPVENEVKRSPICRKNATCFMLGA